MRMDVTADLVIARPRAEVAAYVIDPGHDPAWIGGISQAEVLTEPPVRVGTRVRRVASFLGRRIEYVLEVSALDPDALLEMTSVRSPFPMKVTYAFADAPGGTRASVRVEGEPSGLYRLAGPAHAPAVRRSVASDLRSLRGILESGNRGEV
ncbi:MAG: SRPBCC family protein [Actinobacteria bacterium]|nr:SRPBCC family protein [Actinomycetota bacterium]